MKQAINVLRHAKLGLNASSSQWTETDREFFKSINAAIEKLEEPEPNPLDDIFIVITERDTPNAMKSGGAIIMETYTSSANMVNAVDNAKRFGDRYGQKFIYKVVPVGTVEECEKIINKPI